MPEMPEVEQVRKTVEPYVKGRTIINCEVLLPRMIKHPSAEEFVSRVSGRKIEAMGRKGKYLELLLNDGCKIIMHLRMTGALLHRKKSEGEPPYAKVLFELSGGENLWFTDIRTFGTLCLVGGEDSWQDKGYLSLGPEPLSEALTADYLAKLAGKSKQAIKSFILDQSKIAGLGNIYADESLALSGLHPQRPANSLSNSEIEKLCDAVNTVIAQGIKNKGTTFRDYKDGDGKQGENQKHLLVYNRKGEPCKKCGTVLQQIKVGGRGSVFCPVCQKLK